MVPSSITFNWRRCKDIPLGMDVYGQPVALNEKLYVSGGGWIATTVLEYTPGRDQWAELPFPPVYNFTIATLRGQLLVVGGRDKSTHKTTNTCTVLTFDEHSRRWVKSHPAMPTALALYVPAVIRYQNHLIVAGNVTEKKTDVNILDTNANKWNKHESLPSGGIYIAVLCEDTVYLVGWVTKTVLRAHVPTLISGVKSGVWETLQNTLHYRSSPVTIGNTLLTVGGSDKYEVGNPTTSIQMYNPTTNQWTRVGDLPEPMGAPSCIIMNSELFVFGPYSSVYRSKLTLVY